MAGLCAAREADVLLLSKGTPAASAGYLAQGGIAAAVGDDGDPALHADDTVRAGRGLDPAGVYEVELRFAEIVVNRAGLRVFDVLGGG